MPSNLTKYIDRSFYPGRDTNWDDALFRQVILKHVKPDMEILDLGAGAGIVSQMNLRGLVRRVCGVDLDPRVTENPFLDDSRVSDGNSIPYEDASFDLVFSDNVLEHLERPVEVFREVSRVLKPGGLFLCKTPNKWHYMPAIARITPHRFHQFINRLRGRASVDTFPTRYLANSKGDVLNICRKSGFATLEVLHIEDRPEYMRISSVTYLFGLLYERIVNSTKLLSSFRIVLICVLKKVD